MKFQVGDRVRRQASTTQGYKTGVIISCYSRKAHVYTSGTVLGPYPELYDVQWDEGSFERAFLPHGLTKE